MTKSSFNFALVDFLSYVFPGIIAVLALLTVSLFIPILEKQIANIEVTWVTGLIGIAVVYFLGMLSSNSIFLLGLEKRKFTKSGDIENPLNNRLLEDFKGEIKIAFERLFGTYDKWSKNQYYLIRSVVRELAPQSAEYANRQNSLRHMRKNSILPLWLWGLAGVVVGIKIICAGNTIWGLVLIVLSATLTYLLTHILLEGVVRNREFEVRDYCLAFLSLYKLGKLTPEKIQSNAKD